jgi:hypothetical protein
MFSNELWQKSSAVSTYSIDQSIRFNKPDSAALTKTYGSEGTKTAFTMSCWIKPSLQTDYGFLFGASTSNDAWNASTGSHLSWSVDTLAFYSGGTNYIITNRVFRDPSAWYHIVLAVNTAGSGTDKIKLYVNGTLETSFSTDNRSSISGDLYIGDDVLHFIGGQITTGTTNAFWDGYIADFYYIDGSQLTADSFAETNSNGIWIPKEYSGSYGSNGVHIDGRDASDLGDDESGNGNDWSASGLASHDQVADSPTNNFCTINSVYADNAPAGNGGTLSNGNLQFVGGSSTFNTKGLTFNLPKSGKWYFEYMIGGAFDGFGFVKQGEQGTISAGDGAGQLSVGQGGGIHYQGWRNGGNFTTLFADTNTGSPFTAGFIHQVAIDVDNGKFYYGVKNTYYASDAGTDGNPSAGTNHLSTFAFSTTDVVLLALNYSGTQYWNFGQDGTFSGQQTAQGNSDANGVGNFYYAVPTGYLALCTKNLGS